MDAKREQVRVRLRIIGRVQGVYFRASAAMLAQQLGLAGWVQNCADGSVEAIAEGDQEKVDQFIAWCRHGPPGAQVDYMDLERQAATHDFQGFRIKR